MHETSLIFPVADRSADYFPFIANSAPEYETSVRWVKYCGGQPVRLVFRIAIRIFSKFLVAAFADECMPFAPCRACYYEILITFSVCALYLRTGCPAFYAHA